MKHNLLKPWVFTSDITQGFPLNMSINSTCKRVLRWNTRVTELEVATPGGFRNWLDQLIPWLIQAVRQVLFLGKGWLLLADYQIIPDSIQSNLFLQTPGAPPWNLQTPDWDRLGALMLNILHMEPEVFMYLQHMVGPIVEA